MIYRYYTDRTDTLLAAQQQKRHAVEDADVGIPKHHIKQPTLWYQTVEKREQHRADKRFLL
jgi:hypothetical protein